METTTTKKKKKKADEYIQDKPVKI